MIRPHRWHRGPKMTKDHEYVIALGYTRGGTIDGRPAGLDRDLSAPERERIETQRRMDLRRYEASLKYDEIVAREYEREQRQRAA